MKLSEVDRRKAESVGVQMTGTQLNLCTPEGQEWLGKLHGVEALCWNDERLAKVTRLRLVSDVGFPFWDVSYCWGERQDGHPCRVILPFDQVPKRGGSRFIVEEAKRDGVYAKGLGILSAWSTLQ